MRALKEARWSGSADQLFWGKGLFQNRPDRSLVPHFPHAHFLHGFSWKEKDDFGVGWCEGTVLTALLVVILFPTFSGGTSDSPSRRFFVTLSAGNLLRSES